MIEIPVWEYYDELMLCFYTNIIKVVIDRVGVHVNALTTAGQSVKKTFGSRQSTQPFNKITTILYTWLNISLAEHKFKHLTNIIPIKDSVNR